jgi:5,6-dimethylbenzimidazole synthase
MGQCDEAPGGQPPEFDAAFQSKLHDLFVWRRDVRRFRSDPLPSGTLEQLIAEALLGPSVGFSQPWRFVIVDDAGRRAQIVANFRKANHKALRAFSGERSGLYARLTCASRRVRRRVDRRGPRPWPPKHAGDGALLSGRRGLANVAAARARGVGVGWVSIVDPTAVAAVLGVPPEWVLIGYFCLGYPREPSAQPELEREGWERKLSVDELVLRRC